VTPPPAASASQSAPRVAVRYFERSGGVRGIPSRFLDRSRRRFLIGAGIPYLLVHPLSLSLFQSLRISSPISQGSPTRRARRRELSYRSSKTFLPLLPFISSAFHLARPFSLALCLGSPYLSWFPSPLPRGMPHVGRFIFSSLPLAAPRRPSLAALACYDQSFCISNSNSCKDSACPSGRRREAFSIPRQQFR